MLQLENPVLHTLARVDWQFFGGLSFKQAKMPERIRLSMFFAFARRLARMGKLFFPDLPWCLRQEPGEIGGRLHYHFLIGGLPQRLANLSTVFFLLDAWKRIGGGHAKITEFAPTLNGVAYVSKCLGQDRIEADSYESAKFGWSTCQLILSSGLLDIAESRIRAETESHV